MATKQYQRDLKGAEARRRRGMRMMARAVPQAKGARACGVSRQTAMTWQRRRDDDPQAWRRRPLGRPGVFDAKKRARLRKLLLQGAVVNGFPTELWTLRRVATLIEGAFGHAFSISYVWQVLRELWFSAQRPVGRACQGIAAAWSGTTSVARRSHSARAPAGQRPEANPVEYLFGYAKKRELANLCVQTIAEVRRYASSRRQSMQRRPSLVRAFLQQAELAY